MRSLRSSILLIGTSGAVVLAFAGSGESEGAAQAGAVPIGAVIDWWRPNAQFQIPDGFQIADGSTVTDNRSPLVGATLPDLRNRFARGAPDLAGVGRSGGASRHAHQASLPPFSTELESHRHEWAHTILNPDGKTLWQSYNPAGSVVIMMIWSNGIGDEGSGTYPLATAGRATEYFHTALATHGHEVRIPTFTTAPAANDPPYVGLLKIVRIR